MTSIVLLDGGMGQELIARSSKPPSPMWSASVMMEEPEIVEAAHRDYVDAGSTVLTLNTYSVTPERLARVDKQDQFENLQAKAIELAKAARGDRDVSVAGCLPPLCGSYHPELAPDYETSLKHYRKVVACQRDHVDLFLCETLSSLKEIRAAVTVAAEAAKPVWCAMSVKDDDGTSLRSGESLQDGIDVAKQCGAAALLVNCSWPEALDQSMPVLAKNGLPFGGYANGFTKADDLLPGGTVDKLKARTDLGPQAYAKFVMGWVQAGATLVGGCCEVGPAHIAEIGRQLQTAGHDVVRNLS